MASGNNDDDDNDVCPDHSGIMNDPDDFGFGDVSPNTLEAEQQHEQEPEQELNDPDDFGFGDIRPFPYEGKF